MKTYKAIYDPINNDGVYGISLVKNPAMEGLFIALKEDEKKIQLKTLNEEKRILVGLVLEPNKPIYRNQDGEEFNIIFDNQTVEDLCYGFSKNKYISNSTIEHDTEKIIKGVTFVENWLVRDEKIDTAIALGLDAKVGSWVTVMKVDSDEVWNDYVKTGLVQGFSVDAMLSLKEINLNNVNMSEQAKTNSLLEKILLAFTPKEEPKETEEIEVKLGSKKLADGSVAIEYDGEELVAGVTCWIMAEDGTKVPVPIGEHPLEDGTILVVTEEGLVGEIKQAEQPAEEMPVDAQEVAPQTSEADMADEIEKAIKSILIKYSEVESKVETLEKANLELTKQVKELSQEPAAKPIKSTAVQMTAKGKFSELINKINK